jgi:hypothetical protein
MAEMILLASILNLFYWFKKTKNCKIKKAKE